GAAGIALLLGGAGTLAYWNSSATLADVSITSGTLTVASAGGNWSTSPAKWVPGDTFTYSDTLTINATGDNLKAELTIDPASITGDADLKGALVTTMTAAGSGVTANGANKYTVTPNTGSALSVGVTVTVTFPSSISGTTAQNQSVNLNALSFNLT